MQDFDRLIERCVDVVAAHELRERLREGRPLRVKLGIDPSGPLLHLGHAVVLRKLREFQDLGHKVILVVGDFTGQIGDPTGRSEVRRPRSSAEIQADMQSYTEQAGLVLDIAQAEVVYNSHWLAKLSFADLIKLCAKTTVARMLERDDFSKRFADGEAIALHEFLYPLAVAYDSVVLRSDVELGGNEQLFNLLMGRRLQEEAGQRPQICMTLPILEGTDGVARMGKSLNNFIALREPAEQMFGKVMSVPDNLLERYWRLGTTAQAAQVDRLMAGLADGSLSPRDAKLQLAGAIVELYHGTTAAAQARDHFERTVVRKELPTDVPTFALDGAAENLSLAKLLVQLGWAASHREAERLVRQGAVKIDGARIGDARHVPPSWRGKILQKGNHQFVRLV
jgi:tyrosyl-tRNA synthetase